MPAHAVLRAAELRARSRGPEETFAANSLRMLYAGHATTGIEMMGIATTDIEPDQVEARVTLCSRCTRAPIGMELQAGLECRRATNALTTTVLARRFGSKFSH